MEKTGGPEQLRLLPREPGELAAGNVRIALDAAGVNFIDVYFRSGHYPRPVPFVSGLEGAGRVVSVGPGKMLDSGNRGTMSVKKKDVVLYSKYGGTDVEVDGNEYKIFRESEILGIVE